MRQMKKTLITIFTSLIFFSCGKVNNEHTLLYLVNERPDEVVIVDTSDQKVINRFMAGEGLNDLTLPLTLNDFYDVYPNNFPNLLL